MSENITYKFLGIPVFSRTRKQGESRSDNHALSDLQHPATWMQTAFGIPTSSGVTVNEDTALTLSAVWSCVRVLSETLAMLPLNVYSVQSGSRELAFSDPLFRLLHDQPNSRQTSFIFRETMQMHLALTGNAYAIIHRNGAGNVVELELVKWPKEVYVTQSAADGEKYFSYRGKIYANYEMIHIMGISFDGLKGVSPIQYARENFGTGISLQNFGGTFFKNGAHMSGVIEVPSKLDDAAYNRLSSSWREKYSGGSNVGNTAILEAGAKYNPISLSNEDAQYLLSRKFSIEEIARIYRVPLHMIGSLDQATNNNIEHQGIEFATHTMNPYLSRWEQELKTKLVPASKRDKIDIQFDMNGIMRGDSAARATYNKELFYAGAISPNEIRHSEGMNQYEGGDKKYIPVNMVPSEMAGQNIIKQPNPN